MEVSVTSFTTKQSWRSKWRVRDIAIRINCCQPRGGGVLINGGRELFMRRGWKFKTGVILFMLMGMMVVLNVKSRTVKF